MDERFGRPVEILLIEDNPGDVRLTIEALRDAKISNHLTVAPDGVEAMAMLCGKSPHTGASHFDQILLDLNLPKKNGREVLADLKSDPKLKRTPVVILTTSKAEEDILKTYDLHANCYVTKPVGFEQFMQVVRSTEHFWLSVVTLPGGKTDGHQFDSNAAY
jgi:two-component system, chemotaxis family, response regulator Rcp1